MEEQLINHFLSYEFIYIFLLCSLIFLFLAIFIKKNIIKKISILLFSIFLVFTCFEFILSFFMPLSETDFHKQYLKCIEKNKIDKARQVRVIANNETFEFWNENINLNKLKNYDLIFDVSYSKYNNEFRITQCNQDSNETYLFFGCSFTFGAGVEDNETIPYYFSQLYNFNKNIINCGVSGNSTNTALNILNNEPFSSLINKESKIKHCFYTLINEHIYRNFRYDHECVCIDGYLYKNNKWYIPTIIGKIKYIFARSYIFRKVFLQLIDEYNQEYYEDYMIKSLEEINKIVEEKYNSNLTVIVWPDNYGNRFLENLKETNLIFLSGKFNSEEEGYRIKYDGHPTAKANKEIAEILYNHINEIDNIIK